MTLIGRGTRDAAENAGQGSWGSLNLNASALSVFNNEQVRYDLLRR